ncbi:hypothetical protein H3H37_01110 [Duganella sp. LX20W]|uniref:Uncharacterized protein n=1 Tax=Rugamonas brunnea TaxID=2758569 RepID=A0A7W2ENM2_9BURK|nr:hypothetical protein [Rugamonas brunnea]MBA5635660.1 hypothetical protein [Rugamonas brunnea]
MSTISALGARTLPAQAYPAALAQADARPAHAPASKSVSSDSAISLSNSGIDLEKRLSSLGNSTVDLAQSLLGSFAQNLFGDAGKGAAISFNSVSLDAESSLSAAVQHSSGPNGSTDAAGVQLSDSTHFLGKGTITTADGRKFDFEIEVQYSDQYTALAGQHSSSTAPAQGANGSQGTSGTASGTGQTSSPDTSALPTVQFPNVDFPGTLADLFQLIGRNLQSSLSVNPGAGDKGDGNNIDRTTLRSLSLRLLSLVDSKRKDTYAAPHGADTRAKSVADAYGTAPGANDAAQSGATASPAAVTPATTTAASASASASPTASAPATGTDDSASAASATPARDSTTSAAQAA